MSRSGKVENTGTVFQALTIACVTLIALAAIGILIGLVLR